MSEIQVGQINSTDGSTAITTGAGGTVELSAALTGTDATLSGGVYLGGTGAANYLDDYEEGTHETAVTPDSGSITLRSDRKTLAYTKIGNTVHVQGQIIFDSISSPSGKFTISLPFALSSGTGLSERGSASITVEQGTGNVRDYIGIFLSGSVLTVKLGDASTLQDD